MPASSLAVGPHRAVARLIATCGLLAVSGCDPSPTFPTAEQPLPGVVLIEREVIAAPGASLAVSYWGASLRIPADSVPPGTRVLVRFLRDVHKTLAGGNDGNLWTVSGQPAALQILPGTLTFAKPATFTVIGFPFLSSSVQVLTADEADAAWQRRGPGTLPIAPGPTSVSTSVDGPHLWTFAQEQVKLAEPRGTFVQQQLSCGSVPVEPTPADTLTLADDGYVWTRAPRDGACGGVESGSFRLDLNAQEAEFVPSGGTVRNYSVQANADGFILKGQFGAPLDCAADQLVMQWFVPAAPGVDGGAPTNALADGGCAADAEDGDARAD